MPLNLCVMKMVSKVGEIQTCLFSDTLQNSLKPFSVWKTLALRKLKQNFENQLF